MGAALATLKTDVSSLTSNEYETLEETVNVLASFHQATVELLEEKWVTASKIIPLMKMLHHSVVAS